MTDSSMTLAVRQSLGLAPQRPKKGQSGMSLANSPLGGSSVKPDSTLEKASKWEKGPEKSAGPITASGISLQEALAPTNNILKDIQECVASTKIPRVKSEVCPGGELCPHPDLLCTECPEAYS